VLAPALFAFIALIAFSSANGQPVTTDGSVKLKPVMERIDLVTDIAVVRGGIYATTQPGLLLRKSLSSSSTTDFSVFLDVRSKVGRLGSHIPSLACGRLS
jgi:hypothetical protein